MRLAAAAVVLASVMSSAAHEASAKDRCERYVGGFKDGRIAKGFSLFDEGEAMLRGKNGMPGSDIMFVIYKGHGCLCEGKPKDYRFKVSDVQNWRCYRQSF